MRHDCVSAEQVPIPAAPTSFINARSDNAALEHRVLSSQRTIIICDAALPTLVKPLNNLLIISLITLQTNNHNWHVGCMIPNLRNPLVDEFPSVPYQSERISPLLLTLTNEAGEIRLKPTKNKSAPGQQSGRCSSPHSLPIVSIRFNVIGLHSIYFLISQQFFKVAAIPLNSQYRDREWGRIHWEMRSWRN